MAQVLRAKGFFWLAGRDDLGGEWSQAGSILRLTSGAPWFVALPKEAWPDVDVRFTKPLEWRLLMKKLEMHHARPDEESDRFCQCPSRNRRCFLLPQWLSHHRYIEGLQCAQIISEVKGQELHSMIEIRPMRLVLG